MHYSTVVCCCRKLILAYVNTWYLHTTLLVERNPSNTMVSFKKWFPFLGSSRKEASARERLKARSRFVGQNSSPSSTSNDVESGSISR